jgi:hypothetical protein
MKTHICDNKTPKYTTKIKVESLQDDSTRYLFQKRRTEKNRNTYITESDGVEESWAKVKSNILPSAKKVLGKRNINKVKEKCKENKKAYLKYMSTKTQEA